MNTLHCLPYIAVWTILLYNLLPVAIEHNLRLCVHIGGDKLFTLLCHSAPLQTTTDEMACKVVHMRNMGVQCRLRDSLYDDTQV